MSTAISYTSESSDHYLSLYEGKSIKDIVALEKELYGDEFPYLEVRNIETHDEWLSTGLLNRLLNEAIETAGEE